MSEQPSIEPSLVKPSILEMMVESKMPLERFKAYEKMLNDEITELTEALRKASVGLIDSNNRLSATNFFLIDYFKTVTHPGVLRMVSDNNEAWDDNAYTLAHINKVLEK